MSRLFAVTKSLEEIVTHFAVDMAPAVKVPSETVEGTPGLIVLEKDGLRLLKSIPWGFPRQTRDMRREGEPPSRIGLVADLTNPLWDRIVVHPRYRCLIPLTHFANPDGVKGAKTRSWFSKNRQPLMAWVLICAES
ncbi:putative SOS response-associated peptidase YedK [Rhizobium binae]|uniref:SOS response-associated peptidase YedK n=1 Tax=Rhizobium binae TaxID=1138190 RepID=A0ABV2MPA0_9HYPH|nr:hypothetical protein [Rhizobium binae]